MSTGATARRLETVPALREELTLHEGPRTLEGAPTWTLHDPVVNRFYRLGWPEFEMLSRWHLARPEAIAAAVSARTALSVSVDDVEALVRFLSASQLLQVSGSAATEALVNQAAARRRHWASSLLHNYLFFRIPLVRPQGLLQTLRPLAAMLYTRGFLYAVIAAALVGLWLVGRQWDQFLASLPYVFTLEGLLLTGCALTLAKVIHELGHAMTADRYGCRVPTMGVAFLVLWPVLYTDTTDAWKLQSRRQRLAIGAAGMAAELALAAFATLAWCVLPPGALRSACFVLATSTWVLTLAVNLNPFMRFDGYYLLSDALDVPNLQDRSFTLARWWLRERLFGFGDAPPEPWPARRRRLLIAYAFTTWVYRFFLFLGIALLVYHMFFKLLGIALFAVEMLWFIVLPIARELKVWFERRGELHLNRRTIATTLGLAMMLALLVIPWRGTVSSPAVLRAQQQSVLYTPSAAQLAQINVQPGARVRQGDVLFQFASADLAHEQAQAEREVRVLDWEAEVQSMRRRAGENAQPVHEELEKARATWASHEVERRRLAVAAPFDGVVAEVSDPLAANDWLAEGEPLGLLIDPASGLIEAYIAEADLSRVHVAASARFYPEDAARSAVDATVTSIDRVSARTLSEQALASVHGGAIAVRQAHDGTLTPEEPIYRIRLKPADDGAPSQLTRGAVSIDAAHASLLGIVWRRAVGLLVRESGM